MGPHFWDQVIFTQKNICIWQQVQKIIYGNQWHFNIYKYDLKTQRTSIIPFHSLSQETF